MLKLKHVDWPFNLWNLRSFFFLPSSNKAWPFLVYRYSYLDDISYKNIRIVGFLFVCFFIIVYAVPLVSS